MNVFDVGVVDKDVEYCPSAGSEIDTPEGVHTNCIVPLSLPVAVTVTVAVTLVPVVALLVDKLVETAETDAKTISENNNTPTIKTVKIIFLFMLHLWSEHISYIDKFSGSLTKLCYCSLDEYRWFAC